MNKLKYGIIGLGGIGIEKHLPEYAKLKDDVEIVAACDADEKRLKEISGLYGIPNIFTDYRELLSLMEIDFVSICLPNFLHAPVTIDALMAGKHVHCEKPMAVNALQAQQMLEARNKSGKKLMIGLNNRFTPHSRYVRNYISGGSIGEIYFAKCGWTRRKEMPSSGWFLDKVKSGGGSLIDLGVHFIDLIMYFMDYPELKSVTAKTYNKFINSEKRLVYSNPGAKMETNLVFDVEDLAAGFIELKNDVSLSFEISWASNIEREKAFYEIYGTKGGIRFVKYPGMAPELKILTVVNGEHVDIEPKITPVIFDDLEFKDFISCIRENREPLYAPPEQGVKMMHIIDAIYESSKIGKQVLNL